VAGRLAAAAAFGAAGRFAATLAFVAAGRFGAAVALRAAGRVGVALALGAVRRFGAAVAFGAALGDAARGCDRFDPLGFDGRRFTSAGDLARTFLSAAALPEPAPLPARACRAAFAALTFFFASLAAFLLAFANFRARLSTLLAARTCCFAAAARAMAVVA
jgi:hypothetical protein